MAEEWRLLSPAAGVIESYGHFVLTLRHHTLIIWVKLGARLSAAQNEIGDRSTMEGKFVGKVALVTGGASGIGRASALAFSREGATVAVCDTNAEGGMATIDMITKAGGRAGFFEADVSKATQVEGLIRSVINAYGALDCAHNNAGILGHVASTVECTEENWDRIVATNLKGVWLCMKYEIPTMVERGSGAIVNTASYAGLRGPTGFPAYVASKHGVVGLTKVAALEYAHKGIRVNAVCPATTLTPMVQRFYDGDPTLPERASKIIPMGRLGKPEDIAKAVIWLCSDDSSFVTGQALPLDGGQTAR